jgi:long chain fatty acid CoA FadD26
MSIPDREANMILPLFRATQAWPNSPEIERTVAGCHPLLDENRVAAFTLEGARGRRLVVAAEVSRRLHRIWELDLTGDENPLIEEIKAAVRAAVSKRHRLKVDAVVLVPRHTLPRDAEGAIERSACRRAYLEHAFTPMDRACALAG